MSEGLRWGPGIRDAAHPMWCPLSALLPVDLPTFATRSLLEMLHGDSLQLRYAGDRMWPAVRHEETVTCCPAQRPRPGQVVVGMVGAIPDLLRIDAGGRTGRSWWRGSGSAACGRPGAPPIPAGSARTAGWTGPS